MCGEKSPEDIEGKRDLDSPININRRFRRRQNSAEQPAIKSGLRAGKEGRGGGDFEGKIHQVTRARMQLRTR